MSEITIEQIEKLSKYNPKREYLIKKFLSLNENTIDTNLEHDLRKSIRKYSLLTLKQYTQILERKMNSNIDIRIILKYLYELEECYVELKGIKGKTEKELIDEFLNMIDTEEDFYKTSHYLRLFINSIDIKSLQKDDILKIFGCIKNLDTLELNHIHSNSIQQIQAFSSEAELYIKAKEKYMMYFVSGQDIPEVELQKVVNGLSTKYIVELLKDTTSYRLDFSVDTLYSEWKFSKEILNYITIDLKKELMIGLMEIISSFNEHSLILEYIDNISKETFREFINTKDETIVDYKFNECIESLKELNIDLLLYKEVIEILRKRCKEVF